MPVVHLLANSEASREDQEELLGTLTTIFCEMLKVSPQSVHIVISDGRLLSYGGDFKSPAVYITVKSAASQIPPIARQGLVVRMVPALQAAYAGLEEDRVTTFFEEVQVEQMVVGTTVMLFQPQRSGSIPSPRVSEDYGRPPAVGETRMSKSPLASP